MSTVCGIFAAQGSHLNLRALAGRLPTPGIPGKFDILNSEAIFYFIDSRLSFLTVLLSKYSTVFSRNSDSSIITLFLILNVVLVTLQKMIDTSIKFDKVMVFS